VVPRHVKTFKSFGILHIYTIIKNISIRATQLLSFS